MNVTLTPGTYVVAVSGGVDSVVLLDLLARQQDLRMIIAHFDHGIRSDSADDERFVKALAQKYDLTYQSKRVELGSNASEATARAARYEFLQSVQKKHKAMAIITAHHQDDYIETAIINMLRGTKRRGFVSLKETDELKRPLLGYTKQQIIAYAVQQKLEWHQDSTNTESKYLRNKLRRQITKSLTDIKRQEILRDLKELRLQSDEIDSIVDEYAKIVRKEFPTDQLKDMNAGVAFELIAGWLRENSVPFDAPTIARIVNGAKLLQNGAQIDIQKNYYAHKSKKTIILKKR